MLTLDLHGYSVFDARNKIVSTIYYCEDNNISYFKVIHGFNHGTKIKDMILELKNETDQIASITSLNSGESIIYLRFFE